MGKYVEHAQTSLPKKLTPLGYHRSVISGS